MALLFGDYTLTTSAISIAGAGANDQFSIVKATVVNYDTTTRTVTVWRLPAAGTPADANLVVDAMQVLPGETRTLPLSGFNLTSNAVLYAKADANSAVNLSINYSSQ